jgi:hypothetical protein
MSFLRSCIVMVGVACVSDEAVVARPAEPGVLAVTPEPLDFGNVTLGQSTRKTLAVRNSGKVPVLVPTAMSTQPEFTITNNGCDVALASEATCMVEIAFAPKQRGPVLNASIDFREGARTIKSVVLSGTGSTDAALTVVKSGTGTGVVKSQEAMPLINCGDDCSEVLVQTAAPPTVVLEATPAADSSFVGFSGGGCSGTAACVITMDAAKTVAATFVRDKFVLHVDYVEDQPGVGPLTTNMPSVGCAAGCSVDFFFPTTPPASEVAFIPPINASYRFGGDCVGANGAAAGCTVMMNANRTVKVRASKYNYAFITSETFNGNLGGLSGADGHCTRLAAAAGLPGSFKAWLSSDTVTASSRTLRAGGFIRTDGSIWVDSRADLFPEPFIRTPLWFNENKIKVAGDPTFLWTGTTVSGSLQPGLTCIDWSTSASSKTARVGEAQSQGASWTQAGTPECGSRAHLLCLGADLDTPVPLPSPPATFRRAFLSEGVVAPSGGVTRMDSLCQAEATDAGLANAGQFLAFVPPTASSSAASRFGTTAGPWLRVDNVPLAPTAADFLAGRFDAAINLRASGAFEPRVPGAEVLTGYRSGVAPAKPTDVPGHSCNGWTSSTLQLGQGSPNLAGFRLLQATLNDPVVSCAAIDRRVYCLQR